MIKSDDKNKRTIDVVGIIIYVTVAVIITTVIVMTLQSVFGSTIADDNDQQLTITIRPQQMIEEHEELVNDE
jgi:hypothetical protein